MWRRSCQRKSYDGNGNATARQGNSITWTSYNYPVTVNAGSGSTAETVAFSYGPDRKRWQQMYTGNGTSETTNYVGGLLEVVLNGSTTTYRHYINAGSEPVAVYARSSAGNAFSYVLSDHQGSNSDLTNSSATSIVNESFTPFGQRRNPTTWSGAASNSDLTTAAGITRQGYTFQTQLGLWMGMNHMNGRVEDAVTGRMLSADPHVPDRTNTQSYNRFTYVNNNPLTATDPSGFCTPAWACKQDAGSGLGKCRVCGGSDPGSVMTGAQMAEQLMSNFSDPDSGADPLGDAMLSGVTQALSFPAPTGGDTNGDDTNGDDDDQPAQINAPNGASATGTGCNPGTGTVSGNCGPAAVSSPPGFACGGVQCSYQMGLWNDGGAENGVWIQVALATNGGGQWVQSYQFCFFSCSAPAADNANSYPALNYSSAGTNGQYFWDDPAMPERTTSMIWTAQTSYVQPGQSGAAFTLQWGYTLSSNGSVGVTAPVIATPWPYQQQLVQKVISQQQAGPQ